MPDVNLKDADGSLDRVVVFAGTWQLCESAQSLRAAEASVRTVRDGALAKKHISIVVSLTRIIVPDEAAQMAALTRRRGQRQVEVVSGRQLGT